MARDDWKYDVELLEGADEPESKPLAPEVVCPRCLHASPREAPQCPWCGTPFPREGS